MIARPWLTLSAALAAAACAPSPRARLAAQQADAAATTALGRELAGLTPGRPSTCMPRFPASQVKAYGPTIVYTVNPTLKYRTDTAGGCEGVGRGDILITRSTMTQSCQGDIATTVDSASWMFSGSCSFGPFVRYGKGA